VLIPRPYQQICGDKAIAHMRATPEPGVVVVTTAGGKSVITTIVAKVVASSGKRVLCLAPNGDLVSESAKKYRATGEYCSIFSASLNSKATGHHVVFGTPGSVVNALEEFDDEYALLIIDECAGVSDDDQTTYQRIIAHLRGKNPKLRILGLDAVPVRGKEKLIGPNQTFKHVIYELPHHVLSELGWVVKYRLGFTKEHYDLAKLKTIGGKFKQSEVDDATLNKERLSRSIIADMIKIMSDDNRKCAIIFTASIKHAQEVLSYLPDGEAVLITGKTGKTLRKDSIEEARRGEWRYLVTVNALSVGTDIPIVDTVVFLRATESIRLLLQAMGRGCRLWDENWPLPPGEMNWQHKEYRGKRDALILDFGENIERFSLDDDLTITGLVASKNDQAADEEYFEIDCPDCNTVNRHTAQRCVGITQTGRCDYRFIFKECGSCQAQNSPSARHCYKCDEELIDPNKRLTRTAAVGPGIPFQVAVMDMTIRPHWKGESQTLRVDYGVTDGSKSWEVSQFLKPGNYLFHKWTERVGALGNTVDNVMLEAAQLRAPTRLMVKKKKASKYYDIVTMYHDPTIDRNKQLDQAQPS